MDCREFRRKHVAYVDDTLPGIDLAQMRNHLQVCEVCEKQDSEIRRSLLLVRNLPRIEVSGSFAERLAERLQRERSQGPKAEARWSRSVVSRFTMIAAGVAAIAGLSMGVMTRDGTQTPPMLPAVVAGPPAQLDSSTAPVLVASMSTGMLAWPALWLAEQAPVRFANDGVRSVSYRQNQQ